MNGLLHLHMDINDSLLFIIKSCNETHVTHLFCCRRNSCFVYILVLLSLQFLFCFVYEKNIVLFYLITLKIEQTLHFYI